MRITSPTSPEFGGVVGIHARAWRRAPPVAIHVPRRGFERKDAVKKRMR